MKLACGHDACDMCGAHKDYANGPRMMHIGPDYVVCRFCAQNAVRIAIQLASEFAGICIDPNRSCPLKEPEVKG